MGQFMIEIQSLDSCVSSGHALLEQAGNLIKKAESVLEKPACAARIAWLRTTVRKPSGCENIPDWEPDGRLGRGKDRLCDEQKFAYDTHSQPLGV